MKWLLAALLLIAASGLACAQFFNPAPFFPTAVIPVATSSSGCQTGLSTVLVDGGNGAVVGGFTVTASAVQIPAPIGVVIGQGGVVSGGFLIVGQQSC